MLEHKRADRVNSIGSFINSLLQIAPIDIHLGEILVPGTKRLNSSVGKSRRQNLQNSSPSHAAQSRSLMVGKSSLRP